MLLAGCRACGRDQSSALPLAVCGCLRGTDIRLTDDEEMVLDAILRSDRLPGGSVISIDEDEKRRGDLAGFQHELGRWSEGIGVLFLDGSGVRHIADSLHVNRRL